MFGTATNFAQQLRSRAQVYVDLLDAAMFNATALSAGGFFAQCLQLLLDVEGLLAQATQLSVHAAADLERVHETRDDFLRCWAARGRT